MPVGTRLTRLVRFVPLFALYGCAEGSSAGGEPIHPTLAVEAEPLLRIADDDPANPSPIGYATWVSRLADKTIVVADHHAPGIHIFSAAGEHVRSEVRRGDGPGEFLAPRWVSTCGTDELYVWDGSRRLVLVFTPSGDYLREFRFQGEPNQPRCSSTGDLVVLGMPEQLLPLSSTGERSPAQVWIASGVDGSVRESLATVPHSDPRVLGKATRVAVSDALVFVGTGDSPAVATFGLDNGSPRDSVRIGIAGRPSTAEDYRRGIEFYANFMSAERAREIQRERHSQVERPETLPPFLDLFATPSGILWAVVSPRSALVTELQPVVPGHPAGAISSLPFPFQVMEVGEDYILGVAEDAVGMQEIMVLPVR